MGKDVIIALDLDSRSKALNFLDGFSSEKPFVKIGMELYFAEGPAIVREIKSRGHKIFLDLKLHDIPNTVKRSMARLAGLDVDMVNLHAAGGAAMMEAALEGLARPGSSRPLLIAVTQLTSISQERMERELLIDSPLEQVVIHEGCGGSFLTVTPGVRFADGEMGDQARVTTPAQARELGSDYIVVGRPILQAADPVAAYRRCVAEFTG